jgi:hypothetical protein
MNFLSSLFSSSSGAAAGSASAGAASAGATAGATGTVSAGVGAGGTVTATGAWTTSDIISGAANAFGALSSAQAGKFNETALKIEAQNESLRGRAEYVQGQQEANETRDRLLRTLAQQTAAGAASGISLDSGSVRAGTEAALNAAGRELSIGGANAEIARLTRNANARRLLLQGAGEKAAGYARGTFGLLSAYDRRTRIGSVA